MCLDVSSQHVITCYVLFDDDVYDEMTVDTITMIIVLQHTKDV
jgi:hypothetical protein